MEILKSVFHFCFHTYFVLLLTVSGRSWYELWDFPLFLRVPQRGIPILPCLSGDLLVKQGLKEDFKALNPAAFLSYFFPLLFPLSHLTDSSTWNFSPNYLGWRQRVPICHDVDIMYKEVYKVSLCVPESPPISLLFLYLFYDGIKFSNSARHHFSL